MIHFKVLSFFCVQQTRFIKPWRYPKKSLIGKFVWKTTCREGSFLSVLQSMTSSWKSTDCGKPFVSQN